MSFPPRLIQMRLQFATFRQIVFGLIGVVALVSATLCVPVATYLRPSWPLYVLASLPILTSLSCIWLIFHGRIGSSIKHTVKVEMLGAALLSVHNLVFVLFELNSETPVGHDQGLLTALHVIMYTTLGTVLAYDIILSIISITTWYTVDPEVWTRDITESPSPFPAWLIFRTIRVRYGLESRTSTSRDFHTPNLAEMHTRPQLPTSPVITAKR